MPFSTFTKVGSLYRTTLKQGIASNATALEFSDTPFANITYPNWFVLEPNSSNAEIVYMPTAPTGAAFTGVVRGINPGADVDTGDVAYQKGHAANVEVVLAPMHRHWNSLVDVMDGVNGTGATAFRIGQDADDNIYLYAQNADGNKPFLIYDKTLNKWLISNDGVSTYDPSLGGSGLIAGLGTTINASAIDLDLRTSGGLRNNQGVGSKQADVDPTIVARLDTANTWAAVQSATADNVQITTDPDSNNDAVRKSYVDGLTLSSGIAGETLAAGDAIGSKILSTGATLASSTTGSSVNWINPNNIFGAGNATNTTNPTAAIRAIGFNFAVPSTATILGVEVIANIQATTLSTDNSIRLVKAATPSGTAKTLGGINTSLEDKLWGSRFDLWGNTLTYTDVNNASFGVDLNFNNAGTVTLNSVTVNVYYTDDKLYKSSANDVNGFLVAGFAKAGAATDAAVQIVGANTLISGTSLIPGKPVYLSNTAGAVSQTAGTREIILGKAVTTTSWLYEGKKSFVSGTLLMMQTQLVHRQLNFGFRARQLQVWVDNASNGGINSLSSRATYTVPIFGGPPYADTSAVPGWYTQRATGGFNNTGTITITDDGFLAIPTVATDQCTLYYEAYD